MFFFNLTKKHLFTNYTLIFIILIDYFCNMKYNELKQLHAYAKYDGMYLSIVWIASFGCFLASTWQSFLGQFSSILLLSTPFFVAYRLKLFREEGLGGTVSFKRAYLYSLSVFINGSFHFSIMQWVYMKFVDNGKLYQIVYSIISSNEYSEIFRTANINRSQFLDLLSLSFTPFAISLNSFIYGVVLGGILSILIAAIMTCSNKTKKY